MTCGYRLRQLCGEGLELLDLGSALLSADRLAGDVRWLHDALVVRPLHERCGRISDRHREGVALHAFLGDGHRRDHQIEFLGFESGEHAGPRQVEIFDLDPKRLTHRIDEFTIDALVDSVVGDIERRELHFRGGDELPALLDFRQRVVCKGAAGGRKQAGGSGDYSHSASKRGAARKRR